MQSGTSVAPRIRNFRAGLLVGASVCAIVTLSPAAWSQTVPAPAPAAASAPAQDPVATGAPPTPAVTPAVPAPAAPAPASLDQPKWSPYLSVGGNIGAQSSDTIGGARITAFAPVWQDLNSMVFVRFGAGTETHQNLISNFGLGYRTKLNDDWIAGVFAGIDSTQTNFDNTFWQGSFGAEAMSANWDVRMNGYIATQMKPRDIDSYSLFIQDTRIAILQGQESAYSGFDGEVGYRIFNADNLDLRVFAGGFDFTRDSTKSILGGQTFNLGPGNIAGPMGRAELDLYNVDLFGQQSRLIVTGEVTHDDVRGTAGYAGVSLHIPLGGSDSGSDDDELDRRMVDDVRRQDNVLTEFGFSKPQPVILSNGHITSQPTNTLYYVDNTTGAGTYADPTTLKDATSRGPHNQFIVLTDHDGSTVNASGVTVLPGETVTGPGTFTVKGAVNGVTFTHDFAPNSSAITVATADGITVDSNTNLYGFGIASTAPNAIYGHNVTGVVISGLTINGGGAGSNGIYILEDNGTSGAIDINNTSVTGVLADGIKLVVDNATGSTANVSFNLTNITADAGVDGVALTDNISGGSTENLYLGVHNSTLTGGTAGLDIASTASGGGSLDIHNIIDPTYLAGGAYGLRLVDTSNGGSIGDTVQLTDVHVTDATYAGILITAQSTGPGGGVNQNVAMNHVTVDGGGVTYYPIVLNAFANGGGLVVQTATLNDVSATNGHYSNISFNAYASNGGTAHQYVTGTDITATGSVDGDGLNAYVGAYNNGTAIQTIAIDHLTATGNYYDGATFQASARNGAGGSAVAAQYASLTNSNLSNNGYYGVGAFVTGEEQSVARQDLAIDGSTIDNNLFGVYARASAAFYGASEQHISLTNDSINFNVVDGVYLRAEAFALGSTHQTAYLYNDTVYGNGRDGIHITANAFSAGQVLQDVGIYDTDATFNGRDGLFVSTNAYGYGIGAYSAYYSHIGQNITAEYSNFNYNGRNGVEVQNYAGYGAQVDSFVYLYGDTMSRNTASGVYVNSVAEAFGAGGFPITTNINSDLYVVGSFAGSNGLDGIYVNGSADGPTYLIQHITVANTTASDNGRSGFVASDTANNYYSFNAQYVTLSDATFKYNAVDGAAFLATQSYGPGSFGAALQDITIAGSTFNANFRNGLYAYANAYEQQGRAEQHFTIQNSTFDYNRVDGAAFKAYAHDGVLLPGYACDTVQGLPGGCAFVRQTVSILDSHFDYNLANGVDIRNTANNYGAVYNSSGRPANTPTLVMEYSTANGNQGDGLTINNTASNNSYLYSYAVLLGSNFDHNRYYGVNVASSVNNGSSIVQKTVLYGLPGGDTTVSYNGAGGVRINSVSTGGSVQQQIGVYYSDIVRNGSNGIIVGATATPTTGAASITQHIDVAYSRVSYNNGDGLNVSATATDSDVRQSFGIYHSNLNYNAGNGVTLTATGTSNTGPAIAAQYGEIGYSSILGNQADGIAITGHASGAQANTQQSMLVAYSAVNGNGGDGIYVHNTADTGSYLYSYLGVVQSDVNNNGGRGVYVNSAVSGNSAIGQQTTLHGSSTPGLQTTVNDNGGAGLYITSSSTYGEVIQDVNVYYSALDHNGGSGIILNATANPTAGATASVSQRLDMEGSSASYNNGDGLHVVAGTTDGSVVQNVSAFGSYLDHNTGNGATFIATATSNTGVAIAAQYAEIVYTSASYNQGYGIFLHSQASGPGAITQQNASVTYSTLNNNGADGFHASEIAYSGAAADQYLTFESDTISHNAGTGVYVRSIAIDQSSTQQTVDFDYHAVNASEVSYNGYNGIYLDVAAYSGATAQQNVFLYGVDAHHNTGDGVAIRTLATGYSFGSAYIYYSHVSQNVIAAYENFNYNTGNGLSVRDTAYYGGAMNQFIGLYGIDLSHNGVDGIYQRADLTSVRGNSFAFSTNMTNMLYVTNSTIDHNGGAGIDLRSYNNGATYAPAFFGGYSYLIQHTHFIGDDVSYNGSDGLFATSHEQGRYGLNAQYFVLANSTFTHNSGDGAHLQSIAYYGPGGFGDVYENVQISGSHFDYNSGNGLRLEAEASGTQGRAEQHVTVTSSYFDHNHGDGVQIYASAVNGTYVAGHACDTVQGLAGGCAFVRQSVVIQGSDISNNGNDGINLTTYANNYGAIYGASGRPHSPTLEVYGTTVDYNNNRGLNVSNHVTGNSYLYQYVAAIDSTFDHNQSDGVYSSTYAGGGSTALQRDLLYSYHATASSAYNGGNGFKSTIEALGGSYARNVNIVQGANLSYDNSFGFDGTIAYADAASTGLQINAVYFNTIDHNGDGAGLYSIGAGAQQTSYLGGNDVTNNAFVGVYGEANFGSFQYIGVYTFGNTVNSNGTDYLFNSFGGSTQILN